MLQVAPKTLERLRSALSRAGEAGLWLAAAAAAVSLARTTQRVVQERKLMIQAALHDPLTGLANRTMLLHRLEAAIRATSETGQQVGVLFCDLDDFRQINKMHGHAAGDFLLAITAFQIESAVRPSDTVARLGGDEFVVLCPGLSAASDEAFVALEAIATRIRLAVSEPTMLGGSFTGETANQTASETVSLEISIGAAIAPGDTTTSDKDSEADKTNKAMTGWLLRRADLAMSRSKRAKR